LAVSIPQQKCKNLKTELKVAEKDDKEAQAKADPSKPATKNTPVFKEFAKRSAQYLAALRTLAGE
jgi:hypothetical protein